MSDSATSGGDVPPVDHREEVDYVAVSDAHGTGRRMHRVRGDPDAGTLSNGESVEVACGTSLIASESRWKAKPASVYPPGYHPLCQDPACFGDVDVDGQ